MFVAFAPTGQFIHPWFTVNSVRLSFFQISSDLQIFCSLHKISRFFLAADRPKQNEICVLSFLANAVNSGIPGAGLTIVYTVKCSAI